MNFKIIQKNSCKIQHSEKRTDNVKKLTSPTIPHNVFKTTSFKTCVNCALPLKSERSVQDIYVSFKTTTENPLYRFYPPHKDLNNPDFIQLGPRNRSSEICTITFLEHSIIFIIIKAFLEL